MRPRVLTVDDEVEMTELLAFTLRNAGYDVDEAHDGIEALASAHKNHPDLILLDVMLPEIDGFSVCEMIRRTPEIANTPIILLTGWASESARVIGLQAGANDYVVKPFSTRELMTRVNHILHPPTARKPAENRDEPSSNR
jgi:DNA-binding response OmpR family regulator